MTPKPIAPYSAFARVYAAPGNDAFLPSRTHAQDEPGPTPAVWPRYAALWLDPEPRITSQDV
jgi:hypothetical protein